MRHQSIIMILPVLEIINLYNTQSKYVLPNNTHGVMDPEKEPTLDSKETVGYFPGRL